MSKLMELDVVNADEFLERYADATRERGTCPEGANVVAPFAAPDASFFAPQEVPTTTPSTPSVAPAVAPETPVPPVPAGGPDEGPGDDISPQE